MNDALSTWELRGVVIDVGGTRNPAPSYMECLKGVASVKLTVVNIDPDAHPDVLADATALPSADASFDMALCLNLLEHVDRPEVVMEEIARVLRPGGTLILETPFLVKVHGHPQDFHRFTDTALRRMAEKAGLTVTEVTPLGGGPFLAGAAQVQPVVPKNVFIPLLWISQGCDAVVRKFRPQFMTGWPLGYLMVCTKPA